MNSVPELAIVSQLRLYRRLHRQFTATHNIRVSALSRARHFLPWRRSLRYGMTPLNDRQAWIVFAAERFLRTVLSSQMKVFEFGSGGSTLYFLDNGCEVFSVEHDPNWFEIVSERVTGCCSRWRGVLKTPEISTIDECLAQQLTGGTHSLYGSNHAGHTRYSFEAYVKTIEGFADQFFDVVLLDGRARCAAYSLAREKVRAGGYLILDNAERAEYAPIHERQATLGWHVHDFAGPGPYVVHEFWRTTVWQRPS